MPSSNSSTEKVSVIVPAFNSSGTISKCIESLERQSFGRPYEIIVVNDGSTDDTEQKARMFKKARVISQENAGPAKTRNVGARAAKGSIVLFTDADCIADYNWIAEMVKPFEDEKVVGVQGRYRTRQKGVIPVFTQLEIEQRYERMAAASDVDFIGSYAAAYRKSIFIKLKGFDESFRSASGEDPELSFRMAKAGHKMVFNPDAIVYHTHQRSLASYLRTRYKRGYWGRLLYKKHPDKKANGSDKGSSYFISIGLSCMLALLLFILYPTEMMLSNQIFFSILVFIALLGVIVYDSLYFVAKSRTLAVAAPYVVVIVLLRNIAIGTGIATGTIKIR
jgi:glycosyltransferase involved in cell wall biosynthesis